MSELVTPTPTRGGDGAAAASSGAATPAVQAVAELAGERASPPHATFSAVINIKCPDQTGVVRGTAAMTTFHLIKTRSVLRISFFCPIFPRCFAERSFGSVPPKVESMLERLTNVAIHAPRRTR